MDYTKSELQTKLARFSCCLANTSYALMRAEQYQTDNKKCLKDKVQYLGMGIKVLDRYISTLSGGQSEGTLDLTDFEGAFPGTFNFKVLINTVPMYVSTSEIYDDLQELVDDISSGINAIDSFSSTVSTSIISIETTDIQNTTIEIEITKYTGYELINPTVTGSAIYSMVVTPELFAFTSIYNPLDDLLWVLGTISPEGAAISFVDIKTMTIEDFQVYLTNIRNFNGNGAMGGMYNPSNKKMYFPVYDPTDFYVISIVADPTDSNYKEVDTVMQPVASTAFVTSMFYNAYSGLMYFKISTAALAPRIVIMDSTETILATITPTNDAAHSFINDYKEVRSDYDRLTGHTYITSNKRVQVIDSNADSINFNTVIAEYTTPRTATHNATSIVYKDTNTFLVTLVDATASATPVTEYVYEMDNSGNFTEVLSGLGLFNINITDELIIVNFKSTSDSTINKVQAYDYNYNLLSTNLTRSKSYTTAVAKQSDKTRVVYVLEFQALIGILEPDVQEFSNEGDLVEVVEEKCQITQEDASTLVRTLSSICCDSCGSDEKLTEDIQ